MVGHPRAVHPAGDLSDLLIPARFVLWPGTWGGPDLLETCWGLQGDILGVGPLASRAGPILRARMNDRGMVAMRRHHHARGECVRTFRRTTSSIGRSGDDVPDIRPGRRNRSIPRAVLPTFRKVHRIDDSWSWSGRLDSRCGFNRCQLPNRGRVHEGLRLRAVIGRISHG